MRSPGAKVTDVGSDPTHAAPPDAELPRRVVLSIDAMGGDLGPAAVVEGIATSASKNDDLRFILHGDGDELTKLVRKRRIEDLCEIVHANDVVRMDDKPSHVMRHGKDTSMWSAITSVKDGHADACVSCGNTGALMAVSMIRLRKLAGVNRPAIAILWPSRGDAGNTVMLDMGADVKADSQDLLQYALMGTSYARNGFDLKRPRVGLLNVGTEENKGRPELKEAYDLIARHADRGHYDFVGYVEGGDIPSGTVDVVVTDGFTGNIALKSAEGTAKFIREILSDAFRYTILSRLAAVLAYSSLRRLAKRIDPRRVNGGVFLGLNGTVVKSHGSADATGVAAAVKLAYQLAEADFSRRLAARIAESNQSDPVEQGDT